MVGFCHEKKLTGSVWANELPGSVIRSIAGVVRSMKKKVASWQQIKRWAGVPFKYLFRNKFKALLSILHKAFFSMKKKIALWQQIKRWAGVPFKYLFRNGFKALLLVLYKVFFLVLVLICIVILHIFFPTITTKIKEYPNIDNLFITFGSVLSAITALTISLAIIPVQRAIEIFSPTIRRSYINDFVVHIIFISLGISIFISFFLPFLGFANHWKLYLQIGIMAFSLDLVRWHFRRISCLLEPSHAIKSLSKKVCSLISKTQKEIAVSSIKELNKRPEAERLPAHLRQIELYYYGFFEDKYFLTINSWIDELEDITLTAISRKERLTIRYGINAIVEVVCKFLDSRSENFKLYPTGLWSFDSNLDAIIKPVYEKLINVCRLSIHNLDEQSGIQAVNAIYSIAVKTTKLSGLHKHTAPLASWPIGYLRICAELSYKSGLNEISWNVVNCLPEISENAPDNVSISDIHQKVVNELSSIAQQEFILNNDHIGKRAASNICRVACHLIKHNHCDFRTFLSLLLKELEKIVPLMLLKEKSSDTTAFLPYARTNEHSLGHIVSIAASHIKTNKEQWVDPYHQFVELNNEICMHFRNLAEHMPCSIQNSFLSWEIANTIKFIANVYLNIIEQKITDNPQYNAKLIDQVDWYQSFFELMVNNKKEISSQKAEEFSDAMAIIGLMFLNAGYNAVANSSISNMCHICKCYIKKTGMPDHYAIANLLIYIWQFHCLATLKKDTQLVQEADEKIKEVIDLALTKNINIQETFDLRKQQLNNHLDSYESPMLIHSRDYLKLYISSSKTKEDNDHGD